MSCLSAPSSNPFVAGVLIGVGVILLLWALDGFLAWRRRRKG